MSRMTAPSPTLKGLNIIYIHTHDLGVCIEPYGREVETPALSALAREATLFENAHAAAPTCSPSRAAMLTGRTPQATGMIGLAHRGFALARPSEHLGNLLAANGYDTVLSGIQHEFSGPEADGYPYRTVLAQLARGKDEDMESFQRRRDREVAGEAADWIRKRRSEEPFFLSVGFFQPHRPLPEADPDLPASPISGFGTAPKAPADLAALRTSVRLLDRAVGQVLDALKASGQWDRSIILFTTDHGIAFPGCKCSLTDAGTHVALMLRHPVLPVTHGRRISAMVSHLDVLPTLLEWLGSEVPGYCAGSSLMPLITGKETDLHDALYGEVTYHAAYEPMRSIRTRSHAYIRHFLSDRGWRLANVDDSPSKEAWMQTPAFREGKPFEELYDLKADPLQETNLADCPEAATLKDTLAGRLHRHMEATADPLLRGPVPAPLGSRVNHPLATSSHEAYFEEVQTLPVS